MKPEYLYELADLADPDKLWRLSGLDQMELPPEKRRQRDAGVALRRHASHLARLRALIEVKRSLLITPFSPNENAIKVVDTPPDHERLRAHTPTDTTASESVTLTKEEYCNLLADAHYAIAIRSTKPEHIEIDCGDGECARYIRTDTLARDTTAETVQGERTETEWCSQCGDYLVTQQHPCPKCGVFVTPTPPTAEQAEPSPPAEDDPIERAVDVWFNTCGEFPDHRCHYQGEWPNGHWWVASDGDLWPSHPALFKPAGASKGDAK